MAKKKIIFPYQKEESKLFGIVYRPVAEFKIKSPREWITVLAYADSGADVTLLPKSFIDLLGVAFEEGEITEIGGVGGGKVPVIVKEVDLKIGDETRKVKIAIALIEDVPYLLGREDVFEYFEVRFRQKLKSFCFIPENNRK